MPALWHKKSLTRVFSLPLQAYSGQYSETFFDKSSFPSSTNLAIQIAVTALVVEKTFNIVSSVQRSFPSKSL